MSESKPEQPDYLDLCAECGHQRASHAASYPQKCLEPGCDCDIWAEPDTFDNDYTGSSGR